MTARSLGPLPQHRTVDLRDQLTVFWFIYGDDTDLGEE